MTRAERGRLMDFLAAATRYAAAAAAERAGLTVDITADAVALLEAALPHAELSGGLASIRVRSPGLAELLALLDEARARLAPEKPLPAPTEALTVNRQKKEIPS